MICNKCNKENQVGVRFCVNCGNDLIAVEKASVSMNEMLLKQNTPVQQAPQPVTPGIPVQPSPQSVMSGIPVQPVTPGIPAQPSPQPVMSGIPVQPSPQPVMSGIPVQPSPQQPVPNVPIQSVAAVQAVQQEPEPNNGVKPSVNLFEYFRSFFLKPSKTYEEEKEKLKPNLLKMIITVLIISIVVALVSTILTRIIGRPVYKDGVKLSELFNFKFLKEFSYFKTLLNSAIDFILVIGSTLAGYVITSKIMKKDLDYKNLLIILLSVSVIYLPLQLAKPIINLIPISLIRSSLWVIVSGSVKLYQIYLTVTLINKELKIENTDELLKFHFCAILLDKLIYAIANFVFGKILIEIFADSNSGIPDLDNMDLGDLLEMFG